MKKTFKDFEQKIVDSNLMITDLNQFIEKNFQETKDGLKEVVDHSDDINQLQDNLQKMKIANDCLKEERDELQELVQLSWEKQTEVLDQYQELIETMNIYFPKRADRVDCALSDFINSNKDR